MLGGRLKNFLTSGGRKQNVARDLAAFLGVLKEHFKKIRPREGEKNKVNSLKWISFQAWVTRLLFFLCPRFSYTVLVLLVRVQCDPLRLVEGAGRVLLDAKRVDRRLETLVGVQALGRRYDLAGGAGLKTKMRRIRSQRSFLYRIVVFLWSFLKYCTNLDPLILIPRSLKRRRLRGRGEGGRWWWWWWNRMPCRRWRRMEWGKYNEGWMKEEFKMEGKKKSNWTFLHRQRDMTNTWAPG